MNLLLYLLDTHGNESQLRSFLSGFCDNSHQIIVVCESRQDEQLLNNIDNCKIIKVFYAYEFNTSFCSDAIGYDHLLVPRYIYKIEKKRFECQSKVTDTVNNLITFFKRVLDEYEINACHFCAIGGVFRSVGVVVLQEVATREKINTSLAFNTPIKGRFLVYEGIFFKSNQFDRVYDQFLLNKPSLNKVNELAIYFDKYLRFKNDTHVPFMSHRRDINFNWLKSAKLLIIKSLLSIGNKRRKKIDIHSGRPYILFLLSKNNHWYNSYANPELLDRESVIKSIWRSIPQGYDLVLKTHPHIKSEHRIEYIISNMQDCYLDYSDYTTTELVKNCSIVISSGTTAGVEALMQKKHVIEIGKNPAYFGFANPPVTLVTNINNMQIAIKKCLLTEPPLEKINAYFLALLQISINNTKNTSEIDIYRDDIFYELMGEESIKHINKLFL